jgi:hypothetical protein
MKLFPDDFAIFFDWTCLYQKRPNGEARSVAQQASFSSALSRMQMWYAHARTTVIFLTQASEGSTDYYSRGWPTFERAVTMFNKGGQWKDSWPSVVDASMEGSSCVRKAPLTLACMQQLLAQKKFTNGADREIVLQLYAATGGACIDDAGSLNYLGLSWDDKQLVTLHQWLPTCTKVWTLDISHNQFTDAGCANFLELLSRMQATNTLQELYLHHIPLLGRRSLSGLATALEEGAWPSLRYLIALPGEFLYMCKHLRRLRSVLRLLRVCRRRRIYFY